MIFIVEPIYIVMILWVSIKAIYHDVLFGQFGQYALSSSHQKMEKCKDLLGGKAGIAKMMLSKSQLPLFPVEDAKLPVNSEEKFPEWIKMIPDKKHFLYFWVHYYCHTL